MNATFVDQTAPLGEKWQRSVEASVKSAHIQKMCECECECVCVCVSVSVCECVCVV